MKLPLDKRLRKRAHISVGRLQDEVMEVLCSLNPHFVFHGGTCIWRCYSGCRFSEDLDLYLPKLPEGFQSFLSAALLSRGLALSRFKQTANLVFCKVNGPEAEVRVEINFSKSVSFAPIPYEKMDGSTLIVNAVPLPDIIIEKANAYLGRRFIRDIYDVYFLSGQLEDQKAVKALAALLSKFQPPVDEPNLVTIVYDGVAPSFSAMLESLKGRFG